MTFTPFSGHLERDEEGRRKKKRKKEEGEERRKKPLLPTTFFAERKKKRGSEKRQKRKKVRKPDEDSNTGIVIKFKTQKRRLFFNGKRFVNPFPSSPLCRVVRFGACY